MMGEGDGDLFGEETEGNPHTQTQLYHGGAQGEAPRQKGFLSSSVWDTCVTARAPGEFSTPAPGSPSIWRGHFPTCHRSLEAAGPLTPRSGQEGVKHLARP